MTFIEVVNNVLALEGHVGETSTTTVASVKFFINQALRELALYAQFYWWEDEETVTASSGDSYLLVDTDTAFVQFIKDPSGEIIESRKFKTVQEYRTYIGQVSGLKTYYLHGIDSSTGKPKIELYPTADAGDYTIYKTIWPTQLTADADALPGPPMMADYVVWHARKSRLMADEERPSLISHANSMAQSARMHLISHNNGFILDRGTRILARR